MQRRETAMIDMDNRQSKVSFSDEMRHLIERAIEATLRYEDFAEEYEVSIVITDNEGIKELNREFRNIHKETDVLSFPMLEFDEGYSLEGGIDIDYEDINPENGAVLLGDIVISLEKAKEQAEEYGHSVDRELAFLTVHSCLHLMGYDHEMEEDKLIMRQKEEDILLKMGLNHQ